MPDTGSDTGNQIQQFAQKDYADAARRAYGRAKGDTDTGGKATDNTPPTTGTAGGSK